MQSQSRPSSRCAQSYIVLGPDRGDHDSEVEAVRSVSDSQCLKIHEYFNKQIPSLKKPDFCVSMSPAKISLQASQSRGLGMPVDLSRYQSESGNPAKFNRRS